MGELAGDECIIPKRMTRCILPGQHIRKYFAQLRPNVVFADVQTGQRGVDHAHEACDDDGVSGLQALAGEIHRSRSLQFINRQLRVIQRQPFQRGADQTVKQRAAEGK